MGKRDAGGGPGTQSSGPVKTTMTNPLGKRVASKRAGSRGGRSR